MSLLLHVKTMLRVGKVSIACAADALHERVEWAPTVLLGKCVTTIVALRVATLKRHARVGTHAFRVDARDRAMVTMTAHTAKYAARLIAPVL